MLITLYAARFDADVDGAFRRCRHAGYFHHFPRRLICATRGGEKGLSERIFCRRRHVNTINRP